MKKSEPASRWEEERVSKERKSEGVGRREENDLELPCYSGHKDKERKREAIPMLRVQYITLHLF